MLTPILGLFCFAQILDLMLAHEMISFLSIRLTCTCTLSNILCLQFPCSLLHCKVPVYVPGVPPIQYPCSWVPLIHQDVFIHVSFNVVGSHASI